MLLARERIAQIRDALQAKRNTPGVVHTDLEEKLLRLSRLTYDMMSALPHPTTTLPGAPYVRPLGEGISKFAVMGSMGPDLTAFSALLAPGQAWVFDTVHKGTPDASREMVVASTCDFALEFWRRVSAATTDEAALRKMRAYVLGHLCHLAGDIISHPFINDLEWHDGTQSDDKLEHADGESSHDAKVAQRVLNRRSTREGAAWDAWWPTVDDVPAEFFTSYADTLEEIYTVRSRRRTGFGAFEQEFNELNPPRPTSDFVRDGYGFYRNGILSFGYGYGTWNWVAFMLPLTIPLIALPIVAAALPTSQQLFRAPQPGDDEGRAVLQLFSTATSFGGLVTFIYCIWISTLTTHGVEGRTGAGIALSLLSFLFSLSSLGISGDPSVPGEAKAFMFGVPLAIAVVYLFVGIADLARDGRKARSALSLLQTIPLLFLLMGILCWLVYKVMLGGAGNRGLNSLEFWIATGVWSLLIFFGSVLLARYFLRDVKIPEYPRFDVEKKHHVRLFDDNTLYADPATAAPTLAQRFFPSGRRKLLKLWWEGPGELFVRPDRFQLVFSFTNSSGSGDQIVPAPVAPMTLVEFIHLLENRVKDPANVTGKLKASLIFPGDLDYELPPGAAFADNGEQEKTAAGHAAKAQEFRKLPKTPDGDDYILFHAPKPAQSVRFGPHGARNNPFGLRDDQIRTDEESNGFTYVFDPEAVGDGDTIMSFAADFAALLCLGGASHMAPGATPSDRIYQIFRNWCLDRRRVNEWRMLVSGGAVSEKGTHPDKFDPSMLRPPDPNAYTSPLAAASPAVAAEGERVGRELGWVPLLRKWLDMTQRPTVDPLADTRLHAEDPTNHALSRGLAFLLDMSDPVAVR